MRDDEEELFEHESYGMVSLSRVSSSGQTLFGSSVRHHHYVKLSIQRAEMGRHLHREWYYPRENLIEINLSAVQLAEMLTNMNTAGVPCTLSRYWNKDGEYVSVPEPENITKQEQYTKEFKEKTEKAVESLDRAIACARDMAEAKTATKGDRNALVELMESVRQDIASNMPFLLKSFNEKIEDVVKDAKGEIRSHVDASVRAAGLEAGSVEPPALEME